MHSQINHTLAQTKVKELLEQASQRRDRGRRIGENWRPGRLAGRARMPRLARRAVATDA